MKPNRGLFAAAAALLSLCALGSAQAADAVRGKALFFNTNGAPQSCGSAACHAGFPAVQAKGINKGANPSVTLAAIANNKGGMGFLAGYVNSTDAADIAAYIANPAAGNGSPAITLSATSVTFAAQAIATTSPAQTVTVSNTGTAPLTLTSLTLSGATSADFTRGGTCANGSNVAAGGSCSITLSFTPSAAGARSATLTIVHNAASGTSTVAISGTGALGAAVASVTPTTLSFTQTLNTTSAPQAVTVTNTGGQALTIGSLAISGANAAEFALGATSTCAQGTVLNGGASCSAQITFRPTALGARVAALAIAHSATGSPSIVSLNGMATATAQPAISLSTSTLTFGTVSVGDTSAAQTVTVTNSGQAPLVLGSLTLGGTAAGDFTRAGTCTGGATIAPAGTCTIQLAFVPTAVGTRSGTLTVTSNASNGSPVVTLSGTAVQYSISVNPASAVLQSVVGQTSAPVQATVSNTGGSALTVASIAITGPFVLQQGSNSCGGGPLDLSPGQMCNLYIAFLPVAEGAASGEVMITSIASATPARIMLTAQAAAAPTSTGGTTPPTSAVAPTGSSSNVGSGGCTVGARDQLMDPLLALMLAVALFAANRRRGAAEPGKLRRVHFARLHRRVSLGRRSPPEDGEISP